MSDVRSLWRSWGRSEPAPTNAEMLQSCADNIEEAARREGHLLDEYQRTEPGPTSTELRLRIRTAKSDQAHWRVMYAWYREQVSKERPHWAEREPGSDDDEAPF